MACIGTWHAVLGGGVTYLCGSVCAQALCMTLLTMCPQYVQVVIGIGDPNPLVGGTGALTLRNAGVDVSFIGGEEAEACYTLNLDFMQRMQEEAKLQAGPAAAPLNSPDPHESA